MSYKEKVIWILVFLAILSVGIYAYKTIFYPAYYSVQTVCGNITEEELFAKGLIIGGATTVQTNASGFTDIGVSFAVPNKKTVRHEYCHVTQAKQNRFFSCDNQIASYLNELECYTVEKFPVYQDEINNIYNLNNEDL